jgi:ABC-type multidrug transport system fused ATPase/permease subunit
MTASAGTQAPPGSGPPTLEPPSEEIPAISFRRFLQLVSKTWPFIRPLMKHILALLLVVGLVAAAAAGAWLVAMDVFNNKILVGDKLQPLQATLLFVDDSYVAGDVADNVNRTEPLSEAQRKVVRNRLMIWAALGIVLLIPIGAGLLYYNMWIWQSVNQNLRVAMIERAESLSLRFHGQSRVGDAIFRVYQDSAMINSLIQSGIVGPLFPLYVFFVSLVFVGFFDPRIALVCLATLVPMLVITVWFTPRLRGRALANRVANSDLTSRLQEAISALKIVKANQGEGRILDRFDVDSHRALDAAYYLRLNIVLLNALVATLGLAVIIGVEYVLAGWVLEERETFLGAAAVTLIGFAVWNFGAFANARGSLVGSLYGSSTLVDIWARLQDLFVGLQRAFYLLELEPEVVDPADPIEFPAPIRSIEWRNVHFSYTPQLPVLEGVDLRAEVGTITAVVGDSGAGKSTLMSLLLRLYDPDDGGVLINDVDLRSMRIQDIRDNSAIALQKNVLFTGTVADNIGYATKGATRQAIEEAARIACAEGFIANMKAGYDSEIGERGGKLSTGQRQRLNIARAVVRDTPLLILDEPTASLDAETELAVMKNLWQWGRQKIVFIITHRLSTIRNADQIAFLEGGTVKESGSHAELMSIESGHYRRFVEASFDRGAQTNTTPSTSESHP